MPERPTALSRVPRPARWTLTTGWMGLIFWMSAQSGSGAQSLEIVLVVVHWLGLPSDSGTLASMQHGIRKAAHFTEFAVLAALMGWSLRPGTRRWGVAWLWAVLYAVSDEAHQAFVPNRVAAVKDVLIDATGAAFAALVGWWRTAARASH